MERIATIPALIVLLAASPAAADPPEITGVTTVHTGMGWRFDVSVQHPDTGWDHFADGWDIVDADGQRLGRRELFHPHVDEQPFTRSLRNVMIPDGTTKVFIRPHCSRDGPSDQIYQVTLRR